MLIFLFYKNTKYYIHFMYYFILLKWDLTLQKFYFIPSSLLVGFNNIHPILFYYFLFLTIIFSLSEYTLWVKKFFIHLGLLLALFLGMVWGVGNSAWGFFWVNDYVEHILLNLVFFTLILIHFKWRRSLVFFYITYIYFLLVLLFCIRWGLVFTRHNFFSLRLLVNTFKFFCLFIGYLYQTFFFFIVFFFYSIFFLVPLMIMLFKLRKSNFRNKTLFFAHVLFIYLFLLWLKNKIFNISFFTGTDYIIKDFIANILIYSNEYSILLKKKKLSILFFFFNKILGFKYYHSTLIVIMSYKFLMFTTIIYLCVLLVVVEFKLFNKKNTYF